MNFQMKAPLEVNQNNRSEGFWLKISSEIFWGLLVGVLIGVFSILVMPQESHAQNSSFSANQIERAITDYYRFSNPESQPMGISSSASDAGVSSSSSMDAGLPPVSGAGLEDVDLDELADALADQIAILPPIFFNDVLGHLMADYRHNMDHRAPIEILIQKLRTKVAAELQQRRESHPVLTVIGDTFTAFSVAYAFGFGRAVWTTRGQGLARIPRFQAVVRSASEFIQTRNVQVAALLGGSAAGIAEVIYQRFQTQRQDPALALRSVRDQVVRDLATEVVNTKTTLESLINRPEPRTARERELLESQRVDLFRRVSSRLPQLSQAEEQLARIAPSQRGNLEPVEQDLRTCLRLSLSLARLIPASVLDEPAPSSPHLP